MALTTSFLSRTKSNSLFFLSLLLVLSACYGQREIKNGETDSSLGDIVSELPATIWITYQDQHYNYWYGSDGDGLYRYNGETLVHYSEKHGLPNGRIRGIQEDHKGNVFVTSMDGVHLFDGEKFVTLPVVESNEWRLDSTDLWFAVLGKNGSEGPYRYDGKVLHHLKFPKNPREEAYYKANGRHPWSPYDPYTVYRDRTGNIWFGTSEFGLCRYDGKSFGWLYEKHLSLIEGGGSFGIRSIIEDKEGAFWICNTRYRYTILPTNTIEKDTVLVDYKREDGMLNAISPEGKDRIYFQSAVKDDQGDLWLMTYQQGVYRYDGEKLTRYEVKNGTQPLTHFSMYKDRKGLLWLGTNEDGVYRFNGKSFVKFKL